MSLFSGSTMGGLGFWSLAVALSLNLSLTFVCGLALGKEVDARRAGRFLPFVKYVEMALIFLTSHSFFALIDLFFKADYRLALVAKHVSNLQPWYYRIGAVWGNHEGSMLLWVWLLVMVQGIWTMLQEDSPKMALVARGVTGLVTTAFYLYVLVVADPFAQQIGALKQGHGLITMLQDPLLIIHPPILYTGYALTMIPFALIVAFLASGQEGLSGLIKILPRIRLVSLVAWGTLAKGIMLGSYWAYYELGWGGYWFWDPVENASLLPWLALLSLIHLTLLAQRQKKYYVSVLFLGVLVFLMSLLGTFLVRSGILSSVHAFATSPTRGLYILGILAAAGMVGLFLIMARGLKYHKDAEIPSFFSPQTFLLIGIICMLASLTAIAWGTLYPLGLQIIWNKFISVGPPYFEKVLTPFAYGALVLIFLSFLTPLLPSNKKMGWVFYRDKLRSWRYALVLFVLLGLGGCARAKGASWHLCIGMGASGAFVFSMLLALAQRGISQRNIGLFIAHSAFALLIMAVCIDAAFHDVRTFTFVQGEAHPYNGYEVQFDGYKMAHGQNYHAIEAQFTVKPAGDGPPARKVGALTPSWRYYHETGGTEHETSQLTVMGFSHLYASIANMGKEQVTIKLWYRPFILGIWISAFLMMLSLFFFVGRGGRIEENTK